MSHDSSQYDRNHNDHTRGAIHHSEITKQKRAEQDRSEVEEEFIREQKQIHSQGAILNSFSRGGYDDAERQHNIHSLQKLGDPKNSKSVSEAKGALKNLQTDHVKYGGLDGFE